MQESPVTFVCSRCSECFANGEDLTTHTMATAVNAAARADDPALWRGRRQVVMPLGPWSAYPDDAVQDIMWSADSAERLLPRLSRRRSVSLLQGGMRQVLGVLAGGDEQLSGVRKRPRPGSPRRLWPSTVFGASPDGRLTT